MLAMMTAFHNPVFFTLTCTALGLIVGSFLNVVILRLPKIMEQSWRRVAAVAADLRKAEAATARQRALQHEAERSRTLAIFKSQEHEARLAQSSRDAHSARAEHAQSSAAQLREIEERRIQAELDKQMKKDLEFAGGDNMLSMM